MSAALHHLAPAGPTPTVEPADGVLIAAVRDGDAAAFAQLLRRYNQRIYRAARAVLRSESEAEDVVQETFVRAWEHLAEFRGDASLATWLTRIAVHEAFARLRRERVRTSLESDEGAVHVTHAGRLQMTTARGPEEHASDGELQALLGQAIDALSPGLRAVFVLRQVEGLSTLETAECLELSVEAVKVRLHRARQALRQAIDERIGAEARRLLAFDGARCDAMVARVSRALGLSLPA